jgi:hypothetical protein
MKKIACVALLITASLQAQNAPAPKETPQRESAPQNQAQPPANVTIERELPSEEIRRFLDLGYNFDVRQLQPTFRSFPSAQCAIPLMPIPVPDKNFAMKSSPANPPIDPKIVLSPAVPACPVSVAPVITIPLQFDADKKADKK